MIEQAVDSLIKLPANMNCTSKEKEIEKFVVWQNNYR